MKGNLIFKNIGRCLGLLLLQVLVLDHVYLGGYINPVIYILFILMLPTNTNRIWMLVMAFCSGLVVDIFSNMLGFHAFTATLIAFLRMVYVDRIITKDDPKAIETPSIYSVGGTEFIQYLGVLLGIYNLVYFSLVVFDFSDWWRVLLLAVLSTVVSMLLCLLYQVVFLNSKESSSSRNTFTS